MSFALLRSLPRFLCFLKGLRFSERSFLQSPREEGTLGWRLALPDVAQGSAASSVQWDREHTSPRGCCQAKRLCGKAQHLPWSAESGQVPSWSSCLTAWVPMSDSPCRGWSAH